MYQNKNHKKSDTYFFLKYYEALYHGLAFQFISSNEHLNYNLYIRINKLKKLMIHYYAKHSLPHSLHPLEKSEALIKISLLFKLADA